MLPGESCPMCGGPLPCSHNLGVIYNARYFCQGSGEGQPPRHQWGKPSRWLRRVRCTRCGYRMPR